MRRLLFRALSVRCPFGPLATYLVLLALVMPAMLVPAASDEFPFGQELLLDANPMRGSKRVPSLEIATNGATAIDLWCNSMQGQIVVGGGHHLHPARAGHRASMCAGARAKGRGDALCAASCHHLEAPGRRRHPARRQASALSHQHKLAPAGAQKNGAAFRRPH
jgi:hypothetical protein